VGVCVLWVTTRGFNIPLGLQTAVSSSQSVSAARGAPMILLSCCKLFPLFTLRNQLQLTGAETLPPLFKFSSSTPARVARPLHQTLGIWDAQLPQFSSGVFARILLALLLARFDWTWVRLALNTYYTTVLLTTLRLHHLNSL
jgi:hypothetical protein